ncbi:DUF1127 domain-containing protein [Phreatobacter stygius]|nr:DUF1127 domain-containing protein [Phreatobacter stygius]
MTCSACLPVQSAAKTGLLQTLLDRAADVLALGPASHRRAETRAAVGELSARQLADAGIDRSIVCRVRPVIEIRAGLMANLISLQ